MRKRIPRAKLIWNTCPPPKPTFKEWMQMLFTFAVAIGAVIGLFWVFNDFWIVPVCLVGIAIKSISDEMN